MKTLILLWITCVLFIACPASAMTMVQSTFDTDAESWTAASVNSTTGALNYFAPVTYSSTGGNPGGHIWIEDLDDQTTFLGAPNSFLGDISWAYDGKLKYDHIDLTPNPGGTPLQVALVGLIGNGRMLVFPAPVAETTWQTRMVPMREDAGWLDFATGFPVSQAEFLAVLSGVQLFGIEAETSRFFFEDIVGLDNVVLMGVPEPSSLLLALVAVISLYAHGRVRRRGP